MKAIIAAFLMCQCFAVWATECPVTIGLDGPYVVGWPKAKTWYGSEQIAVMLPSEGTWPTTKPGNLISVKLFWYVEGFMPGLENEFEFTIRRLQSDTKFPILFIRHLKRLPVRSRTHSSVAPALN